MRRRLSLIALLLFALTLPLQAQDERQVINVLLPQEVDTLNAMYSTMFFTGILGDLYIVPAWTFNDALNPVPVLITEMPTAENGGISEDGRTLTFTLRDDIFWSDGDPIDSADFVFTADMYGSTSNTPNSSYPYGEDDGIISSVEAPDATTVVVTFFEPFAPWPTTLFRFVLPEHVLAPIYESEGNIDTADWNRAPTIVSGPYVYAEWVAGSFIRFTRNENYWGSAPSIDEIVISFIPDSDAYLAALLAEDGEIGTFLSFADLAAVEETGLYEVQVVPSGYNEQWNVNVNPETGHPALQDVRVREALVLATNREQITNDLLFGLTYPPSSPWENTPYESPNVEAPPYDPERAAALLDEAGWVDSNGDGTRDKDGVELVLRYVTNTRGVRIDTQAVIQQQLMEVGIGTELITYESDIFFGGYGEGGPIALGEYDIAQWSQTTNFPDPNTSIFLCSQIPTEESPEGGNYRGYCNPEVDALFAEQATITDFDARVAVFHQIDELLAQDFVWVGIWHDPDNWQISNRLENVRINALYPFWNVTEWTVSE